MSVRARSTALAVAIAVAACGGGADSGSASDPPAQGPAADSYTITGTITASEPAAVDSDTNDANQVGFKANNDLSTPQFLPSPVLVVGYLNLLRQGPAGRTWGTGDPLDVYRVRAEAGQVVELDFSADPRAFDVDLAIFDENRNLVGLSAGSARYQCVRILRAGEYFVVPHVVEPVSAGGATYPSNSASAILSSVIGFVFSLIGSSQLQPDRTNR